MSRISTVIITKVFVLDDHTLLYEPNLKTLWVLFDNSDVVLDDSFGLKMKEIDTYEYFTIKPTG